MKDVSQHGLELIREGVMNKMRGLFAAELVDVITVTLVYEQRSGGLSLEDYNFSVEKGRAQNPAQQ
jgi:hypothetical protein